MIVYAPMTQTDTCSTSNNASTMTQVSTTYARIAVILLAFNFALTGYVLYSMHKTTQAQIDGISSSAAASTPRTQTLGTPANHNVPTNPGTLDTKESDQ